MIEKNELGAEQRLDGSVTRKSWVKPVVEMHDIEQLTMNDAGTHGDGGAGTS